MSLLCHWPFSHYRTPSGSSSSAMSEGAVQQDTVPSLAQGANTVVVGHAGRRGQDGADLCGGGDGADQSACYPWFGAGKWSENRQDLDFSGIIGRPN